MWLKKKGVNFFTSVLILQPTYICLIASLLIAEPDQLRSILPTDVDILFEIC